MADIIVMFSRWAKSGLSQMFSRVSSSSDAPASSSMEPIRRSAMNDFQRIMRMLPRIEAVLEDAEEREVVDRSMNLWLSELRVLAYEIDDVVDEYEYEMLRLQIETRPVEEAYRCGKQKRSYDDHDDGDERGEGRNILASSSSQVPVISDGMAQKLREIRERFDEIRNDRKDLRLREEDGVRRFAAPQRTRLTSSLVDESNIFGREGDKKKIMEQLLLNSESGNNFDGKNKITVIPIVGMGGVGKTTLAQLIYNDPKIREYFDCQGWIYVSKDFDLMRLTREIYASITKKPWEQNEKFDDLQNSIKKALENFRRIFLVLDDVWNENQGLWESLQLPFHGASVVNILMTTRNKIVADVMRTKESFYLDLPSIEASCQLFKKYALCEDDRLMMIGRKIVEKCGQLPLAVKLLGSHLRFERDEDKWMSILESELWDLKPGKDEILPSLRLSYQWMPNHLKPCFKYFSMFPKNCIPNKNRLVLLWMAQGYIQPKEANKSMEELGGEYFDELLERSFLQPSGFDFFKVHDLIFDLIVFISGEEFIALKLGDDKQNKIIPNNVRHLVVHNQRTFWRAQKDIPAFPSLNKHLTLRSIFYHGQSMFYDFQFSNSMQLRTLHLDFGHSDPTSLMLLRSIASLKHLRYLYIGMRDTYPSHQMDAFSGIFNSFCRLYNLQVLDFSDFKQHFKLQANINNLINLRHLILPLHSPITCGISKLTSLQTLKHVVLEEGSNECGGISEIEGLANVTGNYCIRQLCNATNVESVKKANINKKQNIQRLCLNWSPWNVISGVSFDVDISFGPNYKEKQQSKGLAEAILEALRPHNSLKGLELYDFPGIRFPLWLGDPSYSKLQDLKLCGCNKWDGSCGVLDRGLPCLQKISIINCAKLKQLKIVQSSSLREFLIQNCPELSTLHGLCNLLILEKLEIRRCYNLMIPVGERLPSKLHSVCFEDCWKLTSITGLQHLRSLKVLQLQRCHNLMISVKHQRLPSKLLSVCFEDCWKVTSITGLQHLRSLKELQLTRCPKLQLSLDEQLSTTPDVVKVTDCLGVMEWCRRYGFEYIQKVFKIQELMYHESGGVSIKNLHICDYYKEDFLEDDWIPCNLNTLILRDCRRLRLLPPYQNLSTLRQLKIWNCEGIKYLPGLQLMKSLEKLEIINCHNLKFSPVQRLPSKLQYVLIRNCPRLMWLPGLQQLLCLRDLKLHECCQLMLLPPEQLPFMHQVRLVIINCPKLGEWCRRYNLTYNNEESLFARSSQQIKEAPVFLDNLCVLDYDEAILETQNCPAFRLLGLNVCSSVHLKSIMFDRNMETLKKVRIWNCPQLKELYELFYLRRPEEIDISNCRNLRSLGTPKSFLIFVMMRHPRSLICKSKEIAPGCFFKISKCPKLYLDDEFFNRRDVVEIHACPQLQEWCENYHFAAYFQD